MNVFAFNTKNLLRGAQFSLMEEAVVPDKKHQTSVGKPYSQLGLKSSATVP